MFFHEQQHVRYTQPVVVHRSQVAQHKLVLVLRKQELVQHKLVEGNIEHIAVGMENNRCG